MRRAPLPSTRPNEQGVMQVTVLVYGAAGTAADAAAGLANTLLLLETSRSERRPGIPSRLVRDDISFLLYCW